LCIEAPRLTRNRRQAKGCRSTLLRLCYLSFSTPSSLVTFLPRLLSAPLLAVAGVASSECFSPQLCVCASSTSAAAAGLPEDTDQAVRLQGRHPKALPRRGAASGRTTSMASPGGRHTSRRHRPPPPAHPQVEARHLPSGIRRPHPNRSREEDRGTILNLFSSSLCHLGHQKWADSLEVVGSADRQASHGERRST
jgi:hypothetical protein